MSEDTTGGSDEKFGRSAQLADAGWREPDKKRDEPEFESVSEAAEELTRRRGPERNDEVEIHLTEGGERADPNLALTVEQAADAMVARREAEAELAGEAADAEFLDEIGLDPIAPQLEQSTQESAPAEPREADPIADAIQNPFVVEALQQAEQARAHFAQQVDAAVRVAELAFLAQFPEFRGVTDPGHLKSIASAIAAQNPQRWAAIQQSVQQANSLTAAQAQERQATKAREAEAFRSYANQEDAKLERAVGKLTDADFRTVQSYARDVLALSDNELVALASDRTVRDHRFQRALLDAARYHAAQEASRGAVRKNLPPVQRPGARQPPVNPSARNLDALQAAFGKSNSLKDAAALLAARRASR
jgi:hypothetical protein